MTNRSETFLAAIFPQAKAGFQPNEISPAGTAETLMSRAQTFQSAGSPTILSAARQHLQGVSNHPAAAGWPPPVGPCG